MVVEVSTQSLYIVIYCAVSIVSRLYISLMKWIL